MGDIEQMFHEILVENKDCDVFRFLSRDNYIDPIEDYHINLHLFDNGDSPCIMNWTIKKKMQQANLIPLNKFLSKP